MSQQLIDTLRRIAELAHDNSSGPTVPDVLWEIRGMAYGAIEKFDCASAREQSQSEGSS